jgi:hypothetical protein
MMWVDWLIGGVMVFIIAYLVLCVVMSIDNIRFYKQAGIKTDFWSIFMPVVYGVLTTWLCIALFIFIKQGGV